MENSQGLFIEEVVGTINEVIQEHEDSISLHAPLFQGNEWAYVKDCIDTGWVSSVGKYVDLFETKLADFTGVRRAVAVVNGTAALHMSLILAGVKQGDEVVVPSLTFVATANAVTYCGAIPHFVDCEMRTLGLDGKKLSDYLADITELRQGRCYNKVTNRRIAAVVPMHAFGHAVDLEQLIGICEQYNLVLIEDAAESIGSYYKGRHTGGYGKVAAMSFNGNKTITTGGGGAILTNDEALGDLAKHLTTQAKIAHRWKFDHNAIGYNYRMPNLNAALGCAQLEELPEFIVRKRRLAGKYQQAFQGGHGVQFFAEPEFSRSNYWLNAILIDEDHMRYRDALLARLHEVGIMARPVWKPMHELSIFEHCPRMECRTVERIAASLVNLPSSVVLG